MQETNTPNNQNRSHWLQEEEKLARRMEQAIFPGGEEAIAKLAKNNKQPVRDLIKKLVDPNSGFLELGTLAGFGINYTEVADVPCGGVKPLRGVFVLTHGLPKGRKVNVPQQLL